MLSAIMAVAACDAPSTAQPDAAQSPTARETASMPPVIPPEKETACIQYGIFADQMASDRNNGIPLSKEIAEIRGKPMKAEMAKILEDLATAVYTTPV
jgi:hypothetical protein